MSGTGERARALLGSAGAAREALARQRERVEELECRCRGITGRSDGMPGAGGGRGPERLWCLLADARAEQGRLEREALAQRRRVERAIRAVADPVGREVLHMRYLAGMTWPEIRARIGCSERTVFRLHSRATAEVEERLWKSEERSA